MEERFLFLSRGEASWETTKEWNIESHVKVSEAVEFNPIFKKKKKTLPSVYSDISIHEDNLTNKHMYTYKIIYIYIYIYIYSTLSKVYLLLILVQREESKERVLWRKKIN